MKNKLLYILMGIAIILGIVVVIVKGFNFSIDYSRHQRIEISLGSSFDIKDMKKIAKDSLKSSFKVRKSTLFGTSAIIDVKDISDEEIEKLLENINDEYEKDYSIKNIKYPIIVKEMNLSDISSKTDDEIKNIIAEIKEKYDLEYTKEELTNGKSGIRLFEVEKIKLSDMIRPYIVPMIISIAIGLVYFGIRYHKFEKNAWIKEPARLLFRMVIIQMFLASIIALCRIPVNQYVADVMIFVLLVQVLFETIKNERKAIKIKSEND